MSEAKFIKSKTKKFWDMMLEGGKVKISDTFIICPDCGKSMKLVEQNLHGKIRQKT